MLWREHLPTCSAEPEIPLSGPRRGALGSTSWPYSFPFLMIVDDFHLCWSLQRPDEAHPELVVYSDRILPLAITRQCLEAISGRRPQVANSTCRVEIAQFPARYLGQIGGKSLGLLAVEHGLRDFAPEAPDHARNVSRRDTDVKRD